MDRKKWARELEKDICEIIRKQVDIETMYGGGAPYIVGHEEAADEIMRKIANLLEAFFAEQELR